MATKHPSYLGGHTLVRPGSDWFGKSKTPKKKSKWRKRIFKVGADTKAGPR
jgi:hypothetical protein